MKRICGVVTIFILFSNIVFAQSVSVNVGKMQLSGGSPTVLSGYEQKGFIGEILSQIFDGAGMIKNIYILALNGIHNNFTNNLPKWDGLKFIEGSIYDVGGNIGIGTAGPSNKLQVSGNIRNTGTMYSSNYGRFDGGVQIDGRRAISSTNYSHNAQATANNHYGYFEVLNNAGIRGAYFGYGNGGNTVNLTLDTASRLNISGGSVGIGTSSPSNKLEVAGKIEADSYCDRSGNNCKTAVQMGGLSVADIISSINLVTTTASCLGVCTVSCPSGYTRTGCNHYGGAWDGDSRPTGSNSCRSSGANGGDRNVAICVRLSQ